MQIALVLLICSAFIAGDISDIGTAPVPADFSPAGAGTGYYTETTTAEVRPGYLFGCDPHRTTGTGPAPGKPPSTTGNGDLSHFSSDRSTRFLSPRPQPPATYTEYTAGYSEKTGDISIRHLDFTGYTTNNRHVLGGGHRQLGAPLYRHRFSNLPSE